MREREFWVYAIVRCGGRQEKASVDDVLTVDRLTGEVGSMLSLPALLVVDGDHVVTDPEELGGYEIAAEIIGSASGPKINMIRYKNKTGYRRRLGHRQKYTQVKITGISKASDRPAKAAGGRKATSGTEKATRTSRAVKSKTPAAPDTGAAETQAAETQEG
jgi:large subunit ribosomal protein L21